MKKLSAFVLMAGLLGSTAMAFADAGPTPAPWPIPSGPDKRGPIDPVPPPPPPPPGSSY
jgi:hypothetical protein